jgi:hypothetical protein
MPFQKCKKPIVLLRVFFVFCCLAAVASAQTEAAPERILSFDSHIRLNIDGGMEVRETIEVQAAGDQIRHGIYRDFPTRYKDRGGHRVSVMFEVIGVQRDGEPEPYHTQSMSNGVRIYFGDAHSLLSSGAHSYVFTYKTNRQLGFFKDHDELYWNVTGLGWAFPIDVATATVVLPPQISNFVTGLYGYTGAFGERGRQCTAARDDDGYPQFRAENLAPHHGLTIAVTWPKGLIAEPTTQQKFSWFLSDNRNAAVGLGGLVVVWLYYLVVWARVGRDPRPGTMVPLYEPPDNMSPAAMRYLEKMGFDDKTFTSAILGLAAKGHLAIDQNQSHIYHLTEKADSEKGTTLSPDEILLQQKLFAGSKKLALTSGSSSVMREAQKALSTVLHTGMEKIYFVTNAGYLWPGIALTVLSAVAMLLFSGTDTKTGLLPVAIFMSIWLSGWSVGVFALLHAVLRAWKGTGGVAGRASAIGITLFAIPFVIGEMVGLGVLAWALSVAVCLLIVALIGSNVLFHHLLKAPTRAGRQLMDRVEGFKMFLTAVDGQRLNQMAPPGKTPELFERFLPYALALDVENAWAEQFSQVLATSAGGASDHHNGAYSPSWYSGAFVGSSAAAFTTSFSGGFASAVSSASSPPGSSSGGGGGGGGGGFSGGGGGGGGGGGW